nr:MAG TPA: Receptor Binding Protein [Caudoviricetes sp.]
MADIITYPENGITYDADDASGYLSTRLSGVYSADEDFAVTANGDLTVTVSAGQAWVRPARFRGRSVIMEQPETVTLTAADAVRSRIDRLVLRYDAAAKKTSLTVLTGTPDSASPTAPEITRTALVYDLCLAEIRRPAGSTEVTAADITDTRADEAVCGVMRDGVTGIPTAQLQAQALAIMTQLSTELHTKLDALDAAIAAVESGSFYTKAEADAKFGTPYSLPPATAAQLGGVKVGDYLDVDEDGTLSGKTLYDTIAASVAVKSEPRLVWNYTGETPNQIKQYSYQIPDNVDYLHITVGANPIYTNDIARGSAVSGKFGSGSTWTTTAAITFHANGTLQFECNSKIVPQGFEFTGYHYPTLAELLAETQAAQADTDALAVDQEYRVALLELGLTDGTTTDTRTT